MISASSSGSFKNTMSFLKRLENRNDEIYNNLKKYGEMGVRALANATPVESGITARSWDYEIIRTKTTSSIIWTNSNERNGVNIAILLQYGHATGTGGYVSGYEYINPAIKPIFDQISEAIWMEVTKP